MNSLGTQVSGTLSLAGTTITPVVEGSGLVRQPIMQTSVVSLNEDEDDDDDMDDGDDMFGEDEEEILGGMASVTNQLAAAGPVGLAAAAAIASGKRKRRSHTFETNPSVRKRQATRLLRKLKALINEFSVRAGQQAVLIVASPGNPNDNFKVFGAKPLEDVVKNLRHVVVTELESALSQQQVPQPEQDPMLHELPPIVVDGIPTPVEKMTQAQLRGFIPMMLKFSTGRGKPGWGKENTKPPWWPKHVPWANVRMDARSEQEKNVSWTHALRDIIINCYKYHGREDLLPKFTDEEDKEPPIKKAMGQYISVQTLSEPNGTVSILHVDPNNPVITLSDGTQAQIQMHEGAGGVRALADVATASGDGGQDAQPTQHILITGEDGSAYPVQVSGHHLVSVPVSGNVYHTVLANIHATQDSPGHVQVFGSAGHSGSVIQQAVSLKQEPEDPRPTLNLSNVSLSNNGQVSMLQMAPGIKRAESKHPSGVTTSTSGIRN